MLIAPAGDWTITDNYDVNSFGPLGIVPRNSPLPNPTSVAETGATARAVMAKNAEMLIVLDDGSGTNRMHSPGNRGTVPYVDLDDPVPVGAGLEFATPAILNFRYDAWSFQPQDHFTDSIATQAQPARFEDDRPAEATPRQVGGDVRLASFNVLNYFTTLGEEFDGCDAYADR